MDPFSIWVFGPTECMEKKYSAKKITSQKFFPQTSACKLFSYTNFINIIKLHLNMYY